MRIATAGGHDRPVPYLASARSLHARAMARRALLLVSLSAPLVLIAIQGWSRRWTADDAFIDYRIAANLAHGHGPVFNVGERVEAFTNPLWLAFLAGITALGASPEIPAAVASILLVVLGLALSTQASARLATTPLRGSRAIWLPCGTLAFASIPAAWDYATSGLETGLTLGWLGASYCAVVSLLAPSAPARVADLRRAAWTALLLSAGPLIRPDLALFTCGYGLALLAHTRRRRLLVLVPLLLAPALYEGFRVGYFACVVPNTALAKSAAKANWSQGFKYLCDFGETYWLLPLLGIVAVVVATSMTRDRRRMALVLLPAVLGLVHALYIVRVGGDFMHGRLLLPAAFAVLQCAGVAVVPLDRRHLVLASSALAVIVWSGLCATLFEVPYPGSDRDGIADERGYYVLVAHSPHPLELSNYRGFHLYEDAERTLNAATSCATTPGCAPFLLLDTESAEDVFYTDSRAQRIPAAAAVARGTEVVVARGQVGIFGYRAGPNVMVVDRFGLADWVASRLPVGERGRPGHEKLLPNAWLVSRYGAELPAESSAENAARRALRCGRLAELREAISAPMTMSRFAQNVRVALWSSKLSIPADPEAAERLFCGER